MTIDRVTTPSLCEPSCEDDIKISGIHVLIAPWSKQRDCFIFVSLSKSFIAGVVHVFGGIAAFQTQIVNRRVIDDPT